ncbi:MAG TPA: pyruvate kinase [Pyrinomonadaceae bacterium]|nr:pyruvate kinase [Pyrinomonadaceae bacterium]
MHAKPEPPKDLSTYEAQLGELIVELSSIRSEMLTLEASVLADQFDLHESHVESAKNLLHYLALRRRDLRDIQERLAAYGLSSLGRAESHVRANIEAIEVILRQLLSGNGHEPLESNGSLSYHQGRSMLDWHTEKLLGPKPPRRTVRIMVTMPAEAGSDYEFIHRLLLDGMDCMRINCAYDDAQVWAKMIANVRRASKETGKSCKVLMDLAGPKLRTGPMKPGPQIVKWRPHRNVDGGLRSSARIWLTAAANMVAPPEAAGVCLPIKGKSWRELQTGDVLKFFDARGAARWMTVTECLDDGCWAESHQTTYMGSGTLLHLVRPGHRLRPFPGRVGQLPATEQYVSLKRGQTLSLTRSMIAGEPALYDEDGNLVSPPHLAVTLPQIFDDVKAGEEIWFDDGAIGGAITRVTPDVIDVKITHAQPSGSKLRGDKGINLPDSNLTLPALTEKDLEDLKFIAQHADLVGYSFVRNADDVKELQNSLAEVGGTHLGIILKIETRRAFEQLANLLLVAMRSPAAGVMIARGDLAIECGWERLAEVQEEILWICEAAHMPVIWATQVLESLAKQGLPSRAEITDAAMGERAECVMLNKGPYILQAVRVLDDILQRMETHQNKKRSMLRHLHLADHLAVREKTARRERHVAV